MPELTVHSIARFGSAEYLLLLGLVLFGRIADLFSTWVATPTLVLEANPIARRLGWRGGVGVNLVVGLFLATLPLAAIAVATTSVLVAARNLQSAWLMRTLGEHEYRSWIAARYREARRGVFIICLVLNAGLFGLVGAALMLTSGWALVPFAVGFGIVTYALAVVIYTSLGMVRAARRSGDLDDS